MRFNEELQQKKFTKFSHSFGSNDNFQDESFGGIIHNGKFGWLARGPQFEVYSMKNGQKISYFRFDNNLGFEHAIITSITEIESLNFNDCILAIAIQFGDSAGGCISIYSVQGSKILRCIEIPDKITCCHYINNGITRRTILQMMEGCLAVGTDNGKIILLDLNLSKCKNALYSSDSIEDHISLIPCDLVESSLEFSHIRQRFQHSIQENINFGIELEVIQNAGIVLSLLSILPSLALTAGLEDGRMVIYDLSELQAFHLAYPSKELSPLVKLDYLEPPDDPRACIYIWAFHENPEISTAVMHCLMYEKKYLDDDETCYYEDFQSCNVRLTLPIYDMKTIPITCHSITKNPTHGNEETISLCLLSCKSMEHHTQIFIFDLNQWYKEEMPANGDWRRNLSYLAVFTLKHCQPFDTYIDLNAIAMFNSIQRSEEHFYPIALSFDLVMLLAQGTGLLHWPGLQNQTLDLLNSVGSTVLLEPSQYFNEIIRSNLMPQFCDYNYKSTFSINMQREVILSVALEYNCFGILKECAHSWADGSHLGRHPIDGLSLSTLTEWIWQRAGHIKKRCNLLSVSLFDHSGTILDQRSQKELFYLTRQLKLLSELIDIILTKSNNYIPSEIIEVLISQHLSLKMAHEYQEVLLWFLNIGLLPETSPNSVDNYINGVKYPYNTLKKFYQQRRTKFYKLNNSTLSTRTKSCRMLYIDSFIEHECNPNVLREKWLESGSSNGLYPPPSLQAMLRTLLVPEVSLQNKYILFIYLFLDLHMCAVENEKSAEIVQNLIKFPAVFKLNASVIKTVQAFWNLDHEQFDFALDEIISPFSQDKKLKQWQQELLIESLLIQQQPHLALRVLQARTSPINPVLELKTLMTNSLLAEAFHLARLKCDDDLMKTFLSGCIYLGKWEVLRDLALTEKESNLVSELLKSSKSEKAGNLHFMLLLEKEKYVEALQFLDEMSKKKIGGDIETSKLILQAYNITMTPACKNLSEIYYKNREKLELSAKSFKNGVAYKSECYNTKDIDSPSLPLSCQFLNQIPYDSIGGIFQASALSVDSATNYWDDTHPSLLKPQNVPFIRNPQLDLYNEDIKDLISYPEQYKIAQKRIREESFENASEQFRIDVNPVKRRKIIEEPLSKNKLLKPINVSLLTKFKTKTSPSFDLDQISKHNSVRMQSAQTAEYSERMILSTPLIKSSVKIRTDKDPYKVETEKNRAPLSILKDKNQEDLILRKTYNEKPLLNKEIEEEKSIHFDLPEKESSVSSESGSDSEPQEEPILVKHSSTAQKINDSHERITCRYNCPQRRRSIHSINSSIVSGASLEEFFSPISSRNTTQNNSQIEEPEIIQKTPIRKEISKDSGAYVNMSSGGSTSATTTVSSSRSPLYKPLSRRAISKSKSKTPEPDIAESKFEVMPKQINKSRKSRSKTPEIMMSPTRRSSRILALKNSPNPSDILHSPIARAISLTRQVLESNALKVVEDKKNLLTSFETNIADTDPETPKTLEKISDTEQNVLQPKNILKGEEYVEVKKSESISKISNNSTIEMKFPKNITIEPEVNFMETEEINESVSILPYALLDDSYLKNQHSINFLEKTNNSVPNYDINILTETMIENKKDDEDEAIPESTVEDIRLQMSSDEIVPHENSDLCYLKDQVFLNDGLENEYENQEYAEVEDEESSSSQIDSDSEAYEDEANKDDSEDYVINISSSSSTDKSDIFESDEICNLLYGDIDSRKSTSEDSVVHSESSNNLDLYNSAVRSNEQATCYVSLEPIVENLDEEVVESNENIDSRNEESASVNAEQSSEESPAYETLVDIDENFAEPILQNEEIIKETAIFEGSISQNCEEIVPTEYIDQTSLSNVEKKEQYETTLLQQKNSQATLDIKKKNKKNLNDSQEILLLNLEEKADLPYKHNLRSRGIRAQSVGLDESISRNSSFTDSPSTRRKLRATSVPKNETNTPKKSKISSDSNTELAKTPRRTLRQLSALKRIEESSEILNELSQSKRTRRRLDSTQSEEFFITKVEMPNIRTPTKASNENSPRHVRASSFSSEDNNEKGPRSGAGTKVLQENKTAAKRATVKKNIAAAESKVSNPASTVTSKETAAKPKTTKLKHRATSESTLSHEEVLNEEVFGEKVKTTKQEKIASDSSRDEPETTAKKTLKRRMSDASKPIDEEPNLSSRRLTRTQQKILEKSATIPKVDKDLPVPSKKAQSKSTIPEEHSSPNKVESETESVVSTKNKVGKKRGTKSEDRGQTASKNDSETESIVSATTRKRGSKKLTSKSVDDQSSTTKIDDDVESVSSVQSKASDVSASRKSTRVRRTSKGDKNDTESTTTSADNSKSRKKSTKTEATTKKDENLEVIPEADEQGDNYSEDLDEEIPEMEDDDNISDVSSPEKTKPIKGKKGRTTKKRK